MTETLFQMMDVARTVSLSQGTVAVEVHQQLKMHVVRFVGMESESDLLDAMTATLSAKTGNFCSIIF
jgi:hypothetical protein